MTGGSLQLGGTHQRWAPTLHRDWKIGTLPPLMFAFQSYGFQVLDIPGS